MTYYPNNIKFRIISSSAIARFKADQAFDFNELINNHTNSFSREAREIVLLNYDIWFSFILNLEKQFIRTKHDGEIIGDDLVSKILFDAKRTVNEIVLTMKENPQIFRKTLADYSSLELAISPYLKLFFDDIENIKNDSMYVGFPKIVSSLSKVLLNILAILNEMEHIKSSLPFLIYSPMTKEIYSRFKENCLLERAKIYKNKNGNSTFLIKNYTDLEIDERILLDFGFTDISISGVVEVER